MIPLTLTTFTTWVQEQPEDGTIGYPLDCAHCPIAKCLRSLGYEVVSVGEFHCWIQVNGARVMFRLPTWCSVFISYVDVLLNQGHVRITAAIALEILGNMSRLAEVA